MARDTRLVDATFVHADTSPGAAGTTTGVGAPWTDFEGSHWKINANRIYGVAFSVGGVKSCCYYDSESVSFAEGRALIDYESFYPGLVARFNPASGGTGYAVPLTFASGIWVYKCVAGTQTELLHDSNFGGGYSAPADAQIGMDVRTINSSNVLINISIRSAATPTVTYALKQVFDTSSPILTAGKWGESTYFDGAVGGGGATRIQLFSQTDATEYTRFGFLYIGDSITYGIGSNSGSSLDGAACSEVCSMKVYDQGNQFMAWQNSGQPSSETTNWIPGADYLEAAVSDAVAKGINTAMIMLGTNDAQISFRSAASFKANMLLIVKYLQNNGINRVILNQPPFNNNPAHTGGQHTTCIALLQAYSTALDEIADSKIGVHRGDRTLYAATAADFSNYAGDGIHPNQAGHVDIGVRWAAAWAAVRTVQDFDLKNVMNFYPK